MPFRQVAMPGGSPAVSVARSASRSRTTRPRAGTRSMCSRPTWDWLPRGRHRWLFPVKRRALAVHQHVAAAPVIDLARGAIRRGV